MVKLTQEEPAAIAEPTISEEKDWDSGGLEGIIQSLSKTEVPLPEVVFTSTVSLSSEAQQPTTSLLTPTAVGILDVSSAGGGIPEPDQSSSSSSGAARPTAYKPLGKKAVSSKKTIGAKKLDTSASEVRIESFESVERRKAQAVQVSEDFSLAVALQATENPTDSSRLDAVYTETQLPQPSSYRSTAPPVQPSPTSASNAESFAARDRYTGAKSISSDSFYGRDKEEAAAARARLGTLSSSSAISSDMLHGNSAMDRSDSSSWEGGDWQGSVKGFFDDIQKRIG